MTGASVILSAVKDPRDSSADPQNDRCKCHPERSEGSPGFFGGPPNDTWRKQLAKRGRFDKDSPFCLPQQLNHTRLLSRLSGE